MKEIPFQSSAIQPFECLREGWTLLKPHYWTIFLIVSAGIIVASVVPFGILLGPILCGFYVVFFKLEDGDSIEFSDLLIGFNYILPAFGMILMLIMPQIILFAIAAIPAFLMSLRLENDPNMDPNEIFIYFGFSSLLLIGITLFVSLFQSLFVFGFQLIVEHDLGTMDSFRLSSRAVWRNIGGIIGLLTLLFIIGFVGTLFCFVGIFFVAPYIFATLFVAYRKVFLRNDNLTFSS